MDPQASFIPARTLSRMLATHIESSLRAFLPDQPLALALLGSGSDVLGFDTARSMDHDWGPRLTIVVVESAVEAVESIIERNISDVLPTDIEGFPTRFSRHEDGTLKADSAGTIHRLTVTSPKRLLRENLLIDSLQELNVAVWLSTPMQTLLELTAGEVFLDDDGELTKLREALGFYPDAVWRYQLAALWMRVNQIQPFIGRTGEVGDAAGSAVITASLARDLMRIALLQSGEYAPYPKWLGSAVARTDIGRSIVPFLENAMAATAWPEREYEINQAGIELIRQLNNLELIGSIPAVTGRFHARPFTILPAEEIAEALQASLAGSDCERLLPFVGGIDIVSDSTDAIKNRQLRSYLRTVYAST